MKRCNKCNTDKEDSSFHKRAASIDGLAARCKECQSAYDKNRANNPDRVKAREEYAKTEAGIESANRAKKKWAANNKGQVYEITKSYRERNPNKHKSHGMVAYAIKVGNLHKEPCEECGCSDKVYAHHDDYLKPLNIRWLCSKHHRAWHKKHGEALNP